MPAVEGYTDPQKERLEKKQQQMKRTRDLHKFGQQLITAALATAVSADTSAPVLGVPFEVPTKSAAAQSSSAASSSATETSSVDPSIAAAAEAIASPRTSGVNSPPQEPRSIYGPNGSSQMYTFSEVVAMIRSGRYKVQDFSRSFNFRPEYWRLIETFIKRINGPPSFAQLNLRSQRIYEYKHELFNSPNFERCLSWLSERIAAASLDVNKYKVNNRIDSENSPEKNERLNADFRNYTNKARALALEQIIRDHPHLFPGAEEKFSELHNQIFERDPNGQIVPYYYQTYFGADTRDTEYLECILKMLPLEASIVFRASSFSPMNK